MNINLDNVAKDIYGKIQTRFPNIKIGDENATVLSKKADIPKARFFEFEYTEDDEPLGTIVITLDEDDGVVIEVSGDLANDTSSQHHEAFTFIRSFRKFAKTRLLNFDVQNIGKSNLDKRDYEFRAKPKEIKEEPIMESKMFGTTRISYQDLGETRLVVKHNKSINPEISGARSMHIESIYVENADGERFKYPFKHLSGARALAEHIRHGGNPYDMIGKHITGLSEELGQLRKFKNYVGRQAQISEAMGSVTDKVLDRIEEVKKSINHLQRSAYYESFVESFQAREEQMIPEAIMTDWVDRLTIRTFNEEMKSVFPYLYNLIEADELPIRELSADDLLGETNDTDAVASRKKAKSFNAEAAFETFIENVVNESDESYRGPLFSPSKLVRDTAAIGLDNLLKSEISGGDVGILALHDYITDTELANRIYQLSDDKDVRMAIKMYIDQVDASGEILPLLQNLDKEPGEETGGEDLPPAPAPTPMPAPEAVPPEGEVPPVPGAIPPAPLPPQPVAESKTKLRAKFIKAKTAGAKLDTIFAEGMTIRHAIKESGLTPEQCGYGAESPMMSRSSGVDELLDTISGFWNTVEKNFTIGGTRAKIKVVKAFEDGTCPSATSDDVKQVLLLIAKKDPSIQDVPSNGPTDGYDHSQSDNEQHMLGKITLMKAPIMEGELMQIKKRIIIMKKITEEQLMESIRSLREYSSMVADSQQTQVNEFARPAAIAPQPSAAPTSAVAQQDTNGNFLSQALGATGDWANKYWRDATNQTPWTPEMSYNAPAAAAQPVVQGAKPTQWPTDPASIKAFQQANGLKVDGLIGVNTMQALQKAGLQPPAGVKPVANTAGSIHPKNKSQASAQVADDRSPEGIRNAEMHAYNSWTDEQKHAYNMADAAKKSAHAPTPAQAAPVAPAQAAPVAPAQAAPIPAAGSPEASMQAISNSGAAGTRYNAAGKIVRADDPEFMYEHVTFEQDAELARIITLLRH